MYGVVREVLFFRDMNVVYKIISCIWVLKLVECVFGFVYLLGSEKMLYLLGYEFVL